LRILFLTPQIPFPPHQGTTIRNFNLLAQLSERHTIELLSFAERADRPEQSGPLQQLCRAIHLVPAPRRRTWRRVLSLFTTSLPDMALRLSSPAFESVLARTVRSRVFDIVQIEGLEMGPYLLWLREWVDSLPRTEKSPRIVFEDHNAEYVLQQRAYETDRRHPRRWAGALYSWLQWPRLRRYEATVCCSADAVVAVSDADAAALEDLMPGLDPTVIPNGVDLQRYDPARVAPLPLGRYALVFTGKMDFRPNVDGVLWFCDQVWPRIRKDVPEARFFIVGKQPHRRLERLRHLPGVALTGYVEDTLPYFAGAAVYVVPLRVGGGTRLKVLEAMAMGLPIVSTRMGAEGLGIESGREAILADAPDQFAAAVLGLLRNEARGKELGARARRAVVQRYDWRTIVPRLEALHASLMQPEKLTSLISR